MWCGGCRCSGLVHTQVEGLFGDGMRVWFLRGVPLPAMSVGECWGFKCRWVFDVLDVGIKNAIEGLLVFTVRVLSGCFPGMSEFLSVGHRGERFAHDETMEFIGSGGEPGAFVRGWV